MIFSVDNYCLRMCESFEKKSNLKIEKIKEQKKKVIITITNQPSCMDETKQNLKRRY